MSKLLAVLILCASSVFAADITGKWSGSVEFEGSDAENSGAFFNLKQEGDRVTGAAGPTLERLTTIKAGKVDGNKVHLEVESPDEDMPRLVVLEMTVEGEQMTGDVIVYLRDDTVIKGKLAIKRES